MIAERLLTTKDVANRLGVESRTVVQYIKQGRLRATRLGRDYRITEAALQAFLRRGEMPSTTRSGALVLALANQKGGQGKSTTAFSLGVALHRLGRRVLLVDLDPQSSLSISAGAPVASLTASVYELLTDRLQDPLPLIHQTRSGPDLLPSTIDLALAELELVVVPNRENRLRKALASLRPLYDYILIDCPPSLGLLTTNALVCADEVLIPVQCSFLATRGLAQLLRTVEQLREEMNPALRIAGILPTLYETRTLHAREVLNEMRAQLPDQLFDIIIKKSVRVEEAPAGGLSILEYEPEGDVALAYSKLAAVVDDER